MELKKDEPIILDGGTLGVKEEIYANGPTFHHLESQRFLPSITEKEEEIPL